MHNQPQWTFALWCATKLGTFWHSLRLSLITSSTGTFCTQTIDFSESLINCLFNELNFMCLPLPRPPRPPRTAKPIPSSSSDELPLPSSPSSSLRTTTSGSESASDDECSPANCPSRSLSSEDGKPPSTELESFSDSLSKSNWCASATVTDLACERRLAPLSSIVSTKSQIATPGKRHRNRKGTHPRTRRRG